MIEELKENEIFVFGSNLAGMHLGGSAYQAVRDFGAIIGLGVGMQGQSYAIPTLDDRFQKMELITIGKYLQQLAEYAELRKDKVFLLTKVGQGIANFSEEEMESIMPKFPSNVIKV